MEKIGVRDNFFELGGHSLKATQAVSRIHRELGAEISLQTFFDGPTIADLARAIRESGTREYEPIEPIAPIRPADEGELEALRKLLET